MAAVLGPAGNCEDFYTAHHKSSLEAPAWVRQNGLGAYEYQCGKGVKISDEAAQILGENACENGVVLSVHAPYYISLSSTEPEKRDRSIDYILQTLNAAKCMGAKRIVVHSGTAGSITRREAMELAKDTLVRSLKAADEAGFGDIFICPETMGKVKQLGTVDEVIELCGLDERLIPTIDFGHVNAMTLGGLKTMEDFEAVFDALENKLGGWRAKNFHAHYSRIEYTNAGEKKHHCFAETEYEPEFEPIAEIIAKRDLSPIIICETRGTQTRDAVEMQKICRRYKDAYKA
ncbi:MAG: endonuclease IV [Ruminococcaceae bacterium]|nr:endonuclease IV [Oscillospiraceae bacterium]